MNYSYLRLTSKMHFFVLSIVIGTFYYLFLFNNFFATEVETTFYINFILLFFCFITATSQQAISIYWLHSFFMLVFLNIIPGIQWKTHLFFYFRNGAENLRPLVFQANILIFFWNILFLTFYTFFQKRYTFLPVIRRKYSSVNLVFSFVMMAGLIVALAAIFGVGFLIYRYTVFDEVGGKTSSPLLILFIYFVKPTAFFISVIFFITVKNKWPLKIALILTGVILNFPLAIARFYLLAIILSLYTVFWAYKYKNAWRLFLICIFGFFLSFILTLLRYLSPTSGLHEVFTKKSVTIIGGMDTDAFETLCLTLRYIDNNGFIWGKNIVACIFFFVPRGVWANKPVATNAIVVDAGTIHKLDAISKNYTTISCPIIAESYISFGFFGIILFSFVIAAFAAIMDKYFRASRNSELVVDKVFRVYYGGLVGMLFLVFRGSLMAGYSYTTGFTLAFLFTLFVFGISYKLKLIKVKRKQSAFV